MTNDLPRTGSGTRGMGGNCISRPTEVTSSGVSSTQLRQAVEDLGARSKGKKRTPA